MFFLAPIAHVRSAVEPFAYGFSEVGALLKTSLDVLSKASVACAAEMFQVAFVEVCANLVRAGIMLFAFDASIEHFA